MLQEPDPSALEQAWSWLAAFLASVFEEHLRDVLYALAAGAWGLMRLAGKTVNTGEVGLKFSFGRATRVCEPGFYPLIPVFQTVKIVPARARTLDLPLQTLTTDDGLVYAVDANVVYRVRDVRRALIEVDDYVAALGQMLSVCVHEVLSSRDRASLRVSGELDLDLARAMQRRCAAWGVEVVRAGFTSINPRRETMRVTQLSERVRARAGALARFADAALSDPLAYGLLGSGTRFVPRTRALRKVELRNRERRALRALSGQVERWLEQHHGDLPARERAATLRNARERLELELRR